MNDKIYVLMQDPNNNYKHIMVEHMGEIYKGFGIILDSHKDNYTNKTTTQVINDNVQFRVWKKQLEDFFQGYIKGE